MEGNGGSRGRYRSCAAVCRQGRGAPGRLAGSERKKLAQVTTAEDALAERLGFARKGRGRGRDTADRCTRWMGKACWGWQLDWGKTPGSLLVGTTPSRDDFSVHNFTWVV